ncbi:MAG: nitrate reductase molybdenum cofactor assembly chaperone [Variibacter sp.]|nr:nitrate reductase molybdenum cofactor assembly chaperone [Variibacter sp.]
MKTFRILSALLAYPSQELIDAAPEFAAVIAAEGVIPARERRTLQALIDEIAGGELYDLQERYGLLFDRTRSLALHLFEHVHGESRDRGQAMVDLRGLYEKAGLFIAANELPDFIPLFLEFLSTQPLAEARELLAQPAHILSAMAERLGRRRSAYRAVFDALVAIATDKPDRAQVETLLAEPDPEPTDLAALDAAWEEEEVRFGPGTRGQDACGKEGLIARLRHARRAVTSPAAAHERSA